MNTDDLHHRIRNAIILLTDGHPLKVGDLTLGSKSVNHLSVTGWTLKNSLEQITRQSALTELEETKSLFLQMQNASNELSDFVEGRQIEFCLGYDYGMGSIAICKEISGQVFWETDLKE